MSLFGDGTDDDNNPAGLTERVDIPDTEFDRKTRLDFEKEMLGLYVSDHPLLGTERVLKRHVDCTLAEFRDGREGELRTLGGIVTGLSRKYTKRGDLMATFVLEDLGAALDVMVFPKTMAEHGHLLEDDAIVCVRAASTGATTNPRSSRWRSPDPRSRSTAPHPSAFACRSPRSPTTASTAPRAARPPPRGQPGVRAPRTSRTHDGAAPRRRLPGRRHQRSVRGLRILLGADCIS